MEKTGWIETFSGLLLDERGAWLDNQASLTAKTLATRRETLRSAVKEIGNTGDIALILATEKTILVTDLTLYANSPAMVSSLGTALTELQAAEALLPKVADPVLYRAVDEAHSLPKNRIGALPRDEARQFFRSHDARLVNMDKSRLDDAEKTIVEERKRSIRIAEKAYIRSQEQALGRGQDRRPDKDRERDLEPSR